MENLDATFGTFLSTRLDMRLAGSWEDYQRDSARTLPLATYVHEHMHFFQTIFTGYGHIQWSSHRQMTSFLVSEWKKLIPLMGGKARMPLASCGTTQELQRTSRWLYETSMEQMRLGKARFSMQFGSSTLEECGSVLLKHNWPANPVIEVNGNQRALQTKDLLEGHAHFVERTFLEKVADVSHEVAWSRDGLPDQYTAAYDWFIQECGISRHEEFPAICDLAMQTSWKPVIPTTEKEWRLSNPSWRFIILTRALAETPDLLLGAPKYWPENYSRFCEKILRICEFPQLNEVFEERLASLARKKELMSIEKLIKEGIEFRQTKPWCAVNPPTDLELMYTMFERFKAPFVVIGNQMGTFGQTTVSGGEVVFELQYQALAAPIFGDISPSARQTGTIECAFAKYRIPTGCSFQASHGCQGQFTPSEGVPHPMTVQADGELGGCSFDWLLSKVGIQAQDIELYPAAKFEPLILAMKSAD